MNREDFPLLSKEFNGKKIVYFDSAATSLTPTPVVLAMQAYEEQYTANVHRGSSTLSQLATDAFESGRSVIAEFLGAKTTETIFTRNCTESLNLAAQLCCAQLQAGDEILCPVSEHHSNFVVWQQLAKKHNLTFTVMEVKADGKITPELLTSYITEKTKVFTFAHVSNVLGVVQPVKELARIAKQKGITVVVDGAQGIVHEKIDVKDLGVDYYAFSAHKLFGPTGLGILYGKEELLAAGTPLTYGGEMIATVTKEHTTWNELPWKYEAGTPAIAQVIGTAAAVLYVQDHHDYSYLKELTAYTRKQLETIDTLTLYGTDEEKTSVFSFTIEGVHASDLAHLLNAKGFQLREGHLCAQPLLKEFGIASFARISLLSYNTTEEVDNFITALKETVQTLRG